MLRFLTALITVAIPFAHLNTLPVNAQPGGLAEHLSVAERQVDVLLAAARKRPGNSLPMTPMSNVRLGKTGKPRLRNLRFYVGTGLRRSIAIMERSRAQLDRALRSGKKIEGPAAATFLARYAWFRACYACQNGGYPEARFRALVREALSLDPTNVQALCMKAFLWYERHSKVVTKHVPGSHVWEYQIALPDRERRKIDRTLRGCVRIDPNSFEAWYLLFCADSTVDQMGQPVLPHGKVLLMILRTGKNADAFYFGFNKAEFVTGKTGVMAMARAMLAAYPKYYKYYGKYYGRPPPGKKIGRAPPTTRSAH